MSILDLVVFPFGVFLTQEPEHQPAFYSAQIAEARRFDQQSPYQLLMRLKMTRGAEMLLKPGASVKQVAEDLGFADAFHFSRRFKQMMGLPPAEFARLRHRS